MKCSVSQITLQIHNIISHSADKYSMIWNYLIDELQAAAVVTIKCYVLLPAGTHSTTKVSLWLCAFNYTKSNQYFHRS